MSYQIIFKIAISDGKKERSQDLRPLKSAGWHCLASDTGLRGTNKQGFSKSDEFKLRKREFEEKSEFIGKRVYGEANLQKSEFAEKRTFLQADPGVN